MAGEQTVQVDGRRLRLSNLDKVLYPRTGTTKGEVIDYFSRIAPLMLPHLDRRPVTRKRWPEGVDQPDFFAKDLERGAPSWLPRMPIDHSTGAKDYPLVEEVAALVYLAQVASLELHVPQWRFTDAGERGAPDRLVLDLDPGPGVGLAECAEVARWVRSILSDMGMELFPVTSGSKGIHLYAPLAAAQTSEQASAFAKELARALEADHPDLVISQMNRSARAGKVFLDWSQNNGSKTTIAPYSLRGRDEPTVAAPRTWDELEDPSLRHLRFDEVLERAVDLGDPLAPLAPRRTAPLAPYLAKRSAERTPEPMPDAVSVAAGGVSGAGAADRPRFVIQEHHARRLHYDLRLERDGVLVSWAVPRGIPETTERNHLAVMTEPHPMEYLSFHGEIPPGEYGAGTMTIWDTGVYDLEKWRDDEIIITLHGTPGGAASDARLVLIRTGGSGEKSQWLLHRMKTEAASAKPGATPSAASGRSGPEAGPEAEPEAEAEADDTASGPASLPAPMLAVSSSPGTARATAERWGPWVEFKWDGVRAIAHWDGERMRLRARSGTDITSRYPELTGDDADLGLGDTPLVLDGEIVALDESGRPSFPLLQNRMHLTKARDIARERDRTPADFFVFDLLQHGDRDVTALPLRERRRLLESAVRDAKPPLTVPPVTDDLDAALATARELDLEGAVVKDPSSRYRVGVRSDEWLKVKLTRTQDVVVGAIRPGKGSRRGGIGSLLLGIPDDDGSLQYAGRVGSGFSDAELARLTAALDPLRTDENPFVGIPAADASDALWVRPELVGEVEFAEFTPGGILRHARWRGLRPDREPGDVRRDEG
ncbi:ATP-dependent DNA ligase [Microbacterium arborescens]|uniref:ATP-dependent DNA ligase n=1 Tax=Microbacterium arborescens TaxID=33883 RepID=UPI0025A2757E|nr:ATP-dependent DNA ligase [Microbacterium arborescens]WJM17040.1 ATP-dependent DNA ligase [Microbacterium arborescens]